MFRTKLSVVCTVVGLMCISLVKPALAVASVTKPAARLSVRAHAPNLIKSARPAPRRAESAPQLENSENIQPVLLSRFTAFRQFIKERYGVELFIRSGYRDPAQQAQLYNNHPAGVTVAKPGTSNHEKGQAIDYGPYQSAQINQHLAQFGLKLTVPGEAWHIEVVEPH